MRYFLAVLGFISVLLSCNSQEESQAKPETWRSLFNGSSLDGWTVKITGYDLGFNYGNTFRVEDGILKVAYDEYGEFGRQFGSLFYNEKLSNYRLRVEYRFVGEQANGAPVWGFRDSGIQLHCQSPQSMTKEQEFPVCVEVNLHGGNGTDERPTGDVCTPGTYIRMNNELFKEHCASTSTHTIHGDNWVTIEAEVRGGDSIKHFVNGDLVVEYSQPQLDETSDDAQRLLASGMGKMISEGYISLQSNSHPIEFRKIEILAMEGANGSR